MSDPGSYRDSLLKLVPAEAVAAYTTIGGIAESAVINRWTILYIAYFGLAAILPFYLRFAAGIRSWSRIVVTTISFLIWAISIDPPFGGRFDYDPLYASVVLILWTFAMPIFNFGEKRANAN